MKHVIRTLRSILLLCIFACAAITDGTTHQRRGDTADHLASTAAIYEPVREHTKHLDRIGFASFKDSEHGCLMRYYIAQSVLAPTLVVESTEHDDVILASFAEDWRLDDFVATHPFTERARFPGGVAILERKR
jgi:hypothetical protein